MFYALQHSIGSEMYLAEEGRILTYREFCNLLKNPETRVWFDRLLFFYIDINQCKRLHIVTQILRTIYSLSDFCDRSVRGNSSIDTRLKAENKPLFKQA
ncbi:MAG: hypothetical protein F6K11_00425 [Leptolyngbya sp. SIO3F4]|nr:hypothetical protein [Leptolyngbya sp. SIO3F4]